MQRGSNSDDIIEVDDDVIVDPSFAILINDNREIIVEGKIYKYQDKGVFILQEERIDEFRAYNARDAQLNSSYNDSHFGFAEMDYLTTAPDESSNSGGGGYGFGSGQTKTVFEDAMRNFEIATFRRNPSLWGDLFGYSSKEIV